MNCITDCVMTQSDYIIGTIIIIVLLILGGMIGRVLFPEVKE